jgi:hypothetical protein
MTIEEATHTLEQLLDGIVESINDRTRLDMRQQLLEFKRALPFEPECAELRHLADAAFDDLGQAINRAVLNRMRERSKQLAKHIETIATITNRAERNIAMLRLEHVRAFTTAASAAADAVRGIKSALEANDLTAASGKTEEALDLLMNMIRNISQEEPSG